MPLLEHLCVLSFRSPGAVGADPSHSPEADSKRQNSCQTQGMDTWASPQPVWAHFSYLSFYALLVIKYQTGCLICTAKPTLCSLYLRHFKQTLATNSKMGHLPRLLYAFSCAGKINRKEDNLSLGMDGASSQNFST